MPWNGYPFTATATGSNDHMAEHCRDESCHRLRCVMYKRGKADGWDECWPVAFQEGESAGYASGHADGLAAAG